MTEGHKYRDEEWGLLVGLPQSVVIAASAAQPDNAWRSRAEREAGQQAIAAGRDCGSPLVERIAAHLLAQVGDPDLGEAPPDITPADPAGTVADVLDRARAAVALLADRASADEAAAYRDWLVGIAEEVVGAARSGGVLGVGGERVSEPEQRFVADLTAVLKG